MRGSRVCLVGVLHFLRSSFPCLAYISPWVLVAFLSCVGSDSAEVSGSRRTGGESDSLAMVVHRGVPGELPFPLGKGKGKISEIRYPSRSEYLRAAIQNAEAMGPS